MPHGVLVKYKLLCNASTGCGTHVRRRQSDSGPRRGPDRNPAASPWICSDSSSSSFAFLSSTSSVPYTAFEGISPVPSAMSAEPKVTTTEPTAEVPQSTVFCADDVDLIIRASGELNFRVHKCILSFVSPIFKDMFAIPQPPTDTPSILPHVDVQDSPKTWENILRTIYPMPHPVIVSLDDLESLLFAAKEYEIQFVIDLHKRSSKKREFIREDPLRLYAIACAGGLEDQAKYVARRTEHMTVVRRPNVGDLKGLTLESYHRLISFLVGRNSEWGKTFAKAPIPYESTCNCSPKILYSEIKKNLGIPHLPTDEIYLMALERAAESYHCDDFGLTCAMPAMKNFIEMVAKERDTVSDKLSW